MTSPEPEVRVTTYTVSCMPVDHEDAFAWDITVEYRGRSLWAVKRHHWCLSSDGDWDYEMRPAAREDEWLAAHRFDLDTALDLARKAAPHVQVNGMTPAEALAWEASRS